MRRHSFPLRRCDRRTRCRSSLPQVESLESRRLLAILTVDTAGDSNEPTDPTLSLRDAIEVSNGTLAVSALSSQAQAQISGALGSPNTIDFDIPGTGPFIFGILGTLPDISVPTTIDGTSQPGFSGTPLLEIGGDGVDEGLILDAGAAGSKIEGLDIIGFSGGFGISCDASDVQIVGNYIGLTTTGLGTGHYISIALNGSADTLGGTSPASRNVISKNIEWGAKSKARRM